MAKHNNKARHTAPAKHPHKSQNRVQSTPQKRPTKASAHKAQASQQAPIPFDANDDILLVGEGDFSFAHSLFKHHAHRFRSLTATTLETRDELLKKYPQAEGYINELLAANSPTIAETNDTDKNSDNPDTGVHSASPNNEHERAKQDTEHEPYDADTDEDFQGFSPPSSPAQVPPPHPQQPQSTNPPTTSPPQPQKYTIHYTIDATTLTTPSTFNALTRPLTHTTNASRSHGFTTLLFNFPHVGGRSTDVNRQVRYNQQMLHSFLSQGKIILERTVKAGRDARNRAGKAARQRRQEDVAVNPKRGYIGGMKEREKQQQQQHQTPKSDRYDTDEEDSEGPSAEETTMAKGKPTPIILITLFQGEPYTLWNIRDLARSVGLECRRSWQFEWGIWPGYRHARTLGNLESKDKGKSRGGKGGGEEPNEDGDEEGGDDAGDVGGGEGGGHVKDGKEKKKGKGPGWKGEQREARTYEFGLKNDGLVVTKGKRKRKNGGSDSDED